MRIVNFYSFKGGVGRSLALINVAYHLVQSGQRCLDALSLVGSDQAGQDLPEQRVRGA